MEKCYERRLKLAEEFKVCRKAFDSFMAHYGKFNNVKNYIAIVGAKGDKLQEKSGYYGEMVVLKAA